MRILPRAQAPDLVVQTLSGEPWSLKMQTPTSFTLVIVYRGHHCPICRSYLEEFLALQKDFQEQGVDLVAVSADSEAKARSSQKEWNLKGLRLGYGLSEGQIREWGLYASRAIKDEEPKMFAEPGLFLVSGEGTVYYAAYTSAPFGRPRPQDMLEAVRFVLSNDYPARGEVREVMTGVY